MLNEKLFEDKYKVLRLLGQGGMSRVYLAQNIKLGSLWAIKEICKSHDSNSVLPVEPNILKKLNHPALPRIFDILEDENSYYIIVDYIEGESLDKKLREKGSLPENIVLEWAKQICDVLVYLHELIPNPVIYRDLKPSNIMLTEQGDIKLIDFGIAREYKEESSGDTVYIGTRGYAAPEQYGGGQSNASTDIYSFGVTIYETITGKGPIAQGFGIKQDLSVQCLISDEMKKILEKCTRMDPAQRYQSSRELLDSLNRIGKQSEIPEHEKSDLNKDTRVINKSFKRLVLTVWDNAEFGCELAYLAAKLTGYSVLIADLDLLAPKADLYLNTKKSPERITSEGIFDNSGINIVMNSLEKSNIAGNILTEASVKRRELNNLHIITGNYRIENYEYYRDESLNKFIDKCYRDFDITILLVNRSIYDSYTIISLIKSDFNIIAVRAELDKIREYNEYITFLNRNQQIPAEKTKFVAFEYDEWNGLCRSVFEQVTGYNLIGKISFSKKRVRYRNLRIPYVRRIEKAIISEYIVVLGFFGIVRKPSIINSVKIYFSRSVYNSGPHR